MGNYCSEHTRVELKNGKCWACGEIEGELIKSRSVMIDVARLAIVIIVGLLFIILYNVYISRT